MSQWTLWPGHTLSWGPCMEKLNKKALLTGKHIVPLISKHTVWCNVVLQCGLHLYAHVWVGDSKVYSFHIKYMLVYMCLILSLYYLFLFFILCSLWTGSLLHPTKICSLWFLSVCQCGWIKEKTGSYQQ